MKRRLISIVLCVAMLCAMTVPFTVSAADIPAGSAEGIAVATHGANSNRAVHSWFRCTGTVKVQENAGYGETYGYIYSGTTVEVTHVSGSYYYVVNGSLEGWANSSYFTFVGYTY